MKKEQIVTGSVVKLNGLEYVVRGTGEDGKVIVAGLCPTGLPGEDGTKFLGRPFPVELGELNSTEKPAFTEEQLADMQRRGDARKLKPEAYRHR